MTDERLLKLGQIVVDSYDQGAIEALEQGLVKLPPLIVTSFEIPTPEQTARAKAAIDAAVERTRSGLG